MVGTARNVTKEKGIQGIPDDEEEEDQISWMCAGKKDFVTIKSSHGTKERHQKRLILCNIR